MKGLHGTCCCWSFTIINFLFSPSFQDIPENGSDLAHLSHLHVPSVFSGADLSTQFDSKLNVADHIFKVIYCVFKMVKLDGFSFARFFCPEVVNLSETVVHNCLELH